MADTERRREFTASMDALDAKLDTLEALEGATKSPAQAFDEGVAAAQKDAQAVIEVCAIANAPTALMIDLVSKQATVTEAVAAVRHLAN